MTCTSILMTGGQSTRMGRDKALLEYQSRPLWLFQAQKLDQVGTETLVSVRESNPAGYAGYRAIRDVRPGCGPLAGLLSALQKAKFDPVLLLAVDLPKMTAGYLVSLVARSSRKTGIVPELDGFYQGLSAVYPKRIRSLVEEVLQSKDRSFQHLIRRGVEDGMLTTTLVGEPDRILFENWNTPLPPP